jgi:hypothetical protein
MNALKALLLQRIAEMPDEQFVALDRDAALLDSEELLREKVYRAVQAFHNEKQVLSPSNRIALVFARLLEALTSAQRVPESADYQVSAEDQLLMNSIIQANSGLLHRLAK